MRRRNLIFGLLAVVTAAGARAEQGKKVHRMENPIGARALYLY
jgi:hypothetical protein